jgi:hypothetical protein
MSASLPVVTSDGTGPIPSFPPSGQLPPKRNRTQLSCTHCHRAKLKCDRKYPCSHCIKRGRTAQCTFLPPATRRKPTDSMQIRLQHLESLVKDAMTSQDSSSKNGSPDHALFSNLGSGNIPEFEERQGEQAQVSSYHLSPIPQPPTATSKPTGPTPSGQIVQGMKETMYVGATHWAAILDDVSLAHPLRTISVANNIRSKKLKPISVE